MRNDIINLIKRNLLEIIPELAHEEFSNDETFINLGANSIDRGELITLTLEGLNSGVSRVEFVRATTINELADLMIQKNEKL